MAQIESEKTHLLHNSTGTSLSLSLSRLPSMWNLKRDYQPIQKNATQKTFTYITTFVTKAYPLINGAIPSPRKNNHLVDVWKHGWASNFQYEQGQHMSERRKNNTHTYLIHGFLWAHSSYLATCICMYLCIVYSSIAGLSLTNKISIRLALLITFFRRQFHRYKTTSSVSAFSLKMNPL